MVELVNGLKNRIAVYCPTCNGDGKAIPNAQLLVTEILAQLSRLFGGATATPSQGAWINDDGKLILENVTIVYSFAAELGGAVIDSVVALCEKIKVDGKQEVVSLEVNGELFFV
jgi:hypothetical protein